MNTICGLADPRILFSSVTNHWVWFIACTFFFFVPHPFQKLIINFLLHQRAQNYHISYTVKGLCHVQDNYDCNQIVGNIIFQLFYC